MTFAGFPLLARLAVRRNWVFWLIWIAALWLTTVATVAAYERVVPPGANVQLTMAALGGNPTMRAMLGPPFDLLTAGGFTMWRVGTFVATAAAAMAALGVIRATRAEEEDGRIELLRAGAIGRHAPLAAGVAVASAACLVLGGLIAAVMSRTAPPASGAVATGLGIALVGFVFVGVGAVAAQLTESARSARGLTMSLLGAAYLVRAVADGSSTDSPLRALNWISPLEWAALARPYAAERWWVLALPLALGLVLVGLAFVLEDRRDHGAGLHPTRPGPATAAPSLASARGLAMRLQRSTLIGWAVGIVVFGLTMGSLSDAFGTMLTDTPELAEMFRRMGGGAQVLRDAFYTAMLGILVAVLAMLGVSLLGRLRREEEVGHAEALLATAISRREFALSHLVPALVAPAVLAPVAGGALAVPDALRGGGVDVIVQTAGAGLALVPGVWLVVGVAMLLHGWAPRRVGLGWALVGWSLFVVWIGEILNLPSWLLKLTPFATLPRMPAEPMAWTPVLLETALAVVLVIVGVVGYRRRDIG